MANDANFKQLRYGLSLVPNTTTLVTKPGDIDYDTTSGNFNLYVATGPTTISTASGTQTLTNKTISVSSNNIIGTVNTVAQFDPSTGNLESSLTSATELGYVHGVTSAIQTQLNAKQSSLTFADSLVNTAGTVTLVNDSTSPGASQYYGTNGSSTLGYFSLPTGGGVTSIGTINSQSKSANGAVITGTSLVMQTADASNPGLVSIGTQTLAGSKTFSTGVNTPQIFDNGGGLLIQSSASQNINLTPGSNGFLFLSAPEGTQLLKISTPSNPGTSYLSLYAKSDNNVYTLNSSGVETQISGISTVGAYVYMSNTGYSPTTGNPVIFDTVVEDTNSSYSTGTGLYTIPVSGRYLITTGISGTGTPFIYIAKNGSKFGASLFDIEVNSGAGAVVFNLSSGNTIAITPDRNTTVTGQASYFSIYRIGN